MAALSDGTLISSVIHVVCLSMAAVKAMTIALIVVKIVKTGVKDQSSMVRIFIVKVITILM